MLPSSPASRPARSRSPRSAGAALLAAILALPAFAQITPAPNPAPAPATPTSASDQVVVLDKLEVSEKQDDPLAPLTSSAAAVELAEVAGGGSLIDNSLVSRGRVGTSADVLAFTPGVFAAPPAGNGDGIKISARGSGIARGAGNFFRNGVLFTFDGLPVTGPGGTPYELFETYGLNYTEILLGGNAFDRDALQLGGNINYVTKTGYDASAFEGRIDLGSFGYRKYQVSSGQVLGKADYFVSVASAQADGYQDWSRSSSEGFAGNFGYRFSPKVNNRTFLRYRTTEVENPGSLSLSELNNDPKQANPNNEIPRSNRIQPGSTWLGNKTQVEITPDSRLELNLVHHNAPIDIQPNPSPGGTTGSFGNEVLNPTAPGNDRSLWNFRDVFGQLRYIRDDTLFGRDSTTTASLSVSYEYDADVNVYANNPNINAGVRKFGELLKTADYNGSSDSSLRLANRLGVTDQLWLNTGLSFVYIRRAGEITYQNPGVPPATEPPDSAGKTYNNEEEFLAPRVGLLYKFTPDTEVFANVTRSVEAPNSWQLSGGSSANVYYHAPIETQTAIAYELGTRTTKGAFTGSASVFYSDVTDELLTVPIDINNPGLGTRLFNGPDTYKQGVELGLLATLWSENGFLSAAPKTRGTKVSLLQTFTHNDFGYKNENVFAPGQPQNYDDTADELPGVPRQNYQARLSFDHRSGFYVNGSLFYASSYFADFANVLEAPSYTVFDLGIGYEHPRTGWRVFLDVRNVTDETYVSSAGPILAGGTTDLARSQTRTFNVGDGRGIYGGLTVKF